MALTGLLALRSTRPVRRLRGARQAIVMVMASFGASMALRSLLEFLFTSEPAYFSRAIQIAIPLGFGIRVTPDQILMLALTAVLVIAMHLFMTRTADRPRHARRLARTRRSPRVAGIDVERVIRATWIIGGALACAAGVMVGITVQIRPVHGLRPAAAAVRRRDPRRHRQRARRGARRADRRPRRSGGGAVGRRRISRRDRLPAF